MISVIPKPYRILKRTLLSKKKFVVQKKNVRIVTKLFNASHKISIKSLIY